MAGGECCRRPLPVTFNATILETGTQSYRLVTSKTIRRMNPLVPGAC